MAAALPWLGLGLGVYQTIQSQNMANRAIQAAEQPRLSDAAVARLRSEGSKNIAAKLAQRGLSDSSLLGGALAKHEQLLADAQAGAGTMGNVPEMLWQQSLGMGQGGADTIGNIAQAYMLQKLLKPTSGSPQSSVTYSPFQQLWPTMASPPSWTYQPPLYAPNLYTPPYAPTVPSPDMGYFF